MNNDSFLIEENDIISAKEICKYIEDSETRNRAVANNFAAKIAAKYFENFNTDFETGIHNVAKILEEIEISDIYLNKNYIDVRLYFNSNELCVPKSHFDKDILPVAYMFIKLNEDLSGGSVTGFVIPSDINTGTEVNGYYKLDESQLVSYYDIEPLLITKEDLDVTAQQEINVYDYLDNKLNDKDSFYKDLINSEELRKKLIDAAKANIVFNFVSICAPEQDSQNEELNNSEIEQYEELEEFDSDASLTLDLDIEEDNSDNSELLIETDDNEIQDLEETVVDSEDMVSEDEELIGLDEQDAELEIQSDITNELEGIEEIENIEEEDTPISDISSDFSDFEESVVETPVEFEENIVSTDSLEAPVEYEEIEEQNDEESMDFSTMVTSSLNTIEKSEKTDEHVDLDYLENILNETEKDSSLPEAEEEENYIAADSSEGNAPQIDELYSQGESDGENLAGDFSAKPKRSGLLPVIGAAIVIAGLGYFGYTKFATPQPPETMTVPDKNITPAVPVNNTPKKDAMPLETVENVEVKQPVNEGNSVSIPAIEQNLDASILVSNLTVNWEVPAGYITNNTSKRYFTKMGKIIQLNLKTELLLLNKPPITNKIAVELEFDKTSGKFKIKQITESSGESSVDNIITKTVSNTLDMNLNMNTSSFGNIHGNPVLVIRL